MWYVCVLVIILLLKKITVLNLAVIIIVVVDNHLLALTNTDLVLQLIKCGDPWGNRVRVKTSGSVCLGHFFNGFTRVNTTTS